MVFALPGMVAASVAFLKMGGFPLKRATELSEMSMGPVPLGAFACSQADYVLSGPKGHLPQVF